MHVRWYDIPWLLPFSLAVNLPFQLLQQKSAAAQEKFSMSYQLQLFFLVSALGTGCLMHQVWHLVMYHQLELENLRKEFPPIDGEVPPLPFVLLRVERRIFRAFCVFGLNALLVSGVLNSKDFWDHWPAPIVAITLSFFFQYFMIHEIRVLAQWRCGVDLYFFRKIRRLPSS